MTEHAPDVERNTTYKTREEQEHDERSEWIGSFARTAPPPASTTPGRGHTSGVSRAVGVSRSSGNNLRVQLPTAPAPSSESPRTSHARKNRGATTAAVSQEEEDEEEQCPSFFGPAKQVAHYSPATTALFLLRRTVLPTRENRPMRTLRSL